MDRYNQEELELHLVEIEKKKTREETMAEYAKLHIDCDEVLEKIAKRKEKKLKTGT